MHNKAHWNVVFTGRLFLALRPDFRYSLIGCIMSQQLGRSDSDVDKDFLQYKLVILGDGAIGKTSLSTRFSEDKFSKR